MQIEKVVEQMSKFLASPITKFLTMCGVIIISVLLTSFTTNKSATDQISEFANYQFKNAIREVLAEDVMPRLEENADAIKRLDCMVETQMQSIYDETIRQVEKTYEKYQKGEREFAKVNFDAIAKTWKALPENRKTDALRVKYETLMAYYPKLK